MISDTGGAEITIAYGDTFHHANDHVWLLIGYNVYMQFEVPQFIEIEDKIIGPFTWKQFVYLAGGAGILIVLYLSVPFVFFILFGLPFAALAAGLAFHQINNRPLSIFLESSINHLIKTKSYRWRREVPQSNGEGDAPVDPPPDLTLAQKKSINSLSRRLELHHAEH